MRTIDGAAGEGGGQILRTALALSLATGEPVRVINVRKARRRPGLARQHLAAVQAAAAIGAARVHGAVLGSQTVTFAPRGVHPGTYRFDIGTAGSTVLVLQTVLPALLLASAPSRLTLTGGTHNPLAPSFTFLERAFLPLLDRMGAAVRVRLERAGYYPAGGGQMAVEIEPAQRLAPLALAARGTVRARHACATVCRLPAHIAERELGVLAAALALQAHELETREDTTSPGPGNVLELVVAAEHVTEVFTGYGRRGLPAETVAERVAAAARRYLAAGVPVGEHLADQLLVPLALAGAGAFVTVTPSRHTRTNMAVIAAMGVAAFEAEPLGGDRWRIRAGCKARAEA